LKREKKGNMGVSSRGTNGSEIGDRHLKEK